MYPRGSTRTLAVLAAVMFQASLPLQVLASGSSRGSYGDAGSGSSRDWTGASAGSGSAKKAGSGSARALSGRAAGFLSGSKGQIKRQQMLAGGYFFLRDFDERKVRALTHRKAHSHVSRIEPGKARSILGRVRGGNAKLVPGGAGEVLFACHDFHDVKTGETLDVDVWMVEDGDAWKPVQYLIHKVAGKKRFDYRKGEMTHLE